MCVVICLFLALCALSSHVMAVDVLTGDDSVRVDSRFDRWNQDALMVAMVAEKSGDRETMQLYWRMDKLAVPAIALDSVDHQVQTMRTRLPETCPQIRMVPVTQSDASKGAIWSEPYELGQLFTYRPDLRLLVGKDVPVSWQFSGICLLGRAKEAQSYAPGEVLSREEFLVREVLGVEYSKKIALEIYGKKLSGFLSAHENANQEPAYNYPCRGKAQPTRYYYQLEKVMGVSKSSAERAERQRLVCLWISLDRLQGHDKIDEVRVLREYYQNPCWSTDTLSKS